MNAGMGQRLWQREAGEEDKSASSLCARLNLKKRRKNLISMKPQGEVVDKDRKHCKEKKKRISKKTTTTTKKVRPGKKQPKMKNKRGESNSET